MKYLLTLGLLLTVFTLSAQKQKEAKQVKRALLQIFELCNEESDTRLASLIVYRGEDKERKWKDVCESSEPKELARVQSIRKKIQKRLLPYKYEFVKFISETESEGTWYVWELKYTKDGVDKKMHFAFLKIEDEFALGDID